MCGAGRLVFFSSTSDTARARLITTKSDGTDFFVRKNVLAPASVAGPAEKKGAKSLKPAFGGK